jgi:hypothetical protein
MIISFEITKIKRKMGDVKLMKTKAFKKSLAVILSLILAMSVIIQNISLVYGDEVVKTKETKYLGNAEHPVDFEFEIEKNSEITSIESVKIPGNTSENIIEDVVINGNTVTGSVYGKNAEVVTNGYIYKFKINYNKNAAPVLSISEPPSNIKRYNGFEYIEVKGSVNDPNKEDIKLYYLINKYSSSATQSPVTTTLTTASTTTLLVSPTPTGLSTSVPTPTPKSFQEKPGESLEGPYTIKRVENITNFTCYLPLGDLDEGDGLYELSIWAEDKLQKSNVVNRTFYRDTVRPANPEFNISPNDKYSKAVSVSIKYPTSSQSNIPEKNVKIYYKTSKENVCKLYTANFQITENMTVTAACYDEFGRKSSEQPCTIKNIDNTPPSKPRIAFKSETTVADKPIKFVINHGTDKVIDLKTGKEINGPVTSKYSYDNGKTWFDYTDINSSIEAEISNTKKSGTFKIWAKTIDQAGNESESYKSEDVTIKSSTPVTSPSPTGSQGTITAPNNYVPAAPVSTPTPTSTPIGPTPTSTPIPVPVDLGVFLTSAKTAYEENSTVAFSVYYTNKLSTPADKVVVKAEIPQKATVVDTAKGTVTGNNIFWDIGTLNAKSAGEIIFKIKLGTADSSEVKMSSKVSISSANQMKNTDDDESTFNFISFSKKIEGKPHVKFINGYETKEFKPENMITRAEVAKILVTALSLGKGTDTGKKFTDVDKKHWAYDYIISAVNNGLFSGYSDGTFLPNKAITRAELSTALAKYLKLKNIEPYKFHFNDISKHWAKNYIEEIFRSKLIEGYSDGSFKPDAQIKRCECVTIIGRLLNRGPLKDADCGFIDVKKTHWAYGYIAEGSIDHSYTRNSDGSESKKSK